MRVLSVLSIAALIVLTGCATQKRVSTMEGRGTTQIYSASFDQVWRAAVDAAQHDGLDIITADRTSGYISARRTIRAHTFGENVGLWIRETSPARTQVEVVSRQAGPPVAWLKNWEDEIHRAIAANLTREAVGRAPGDVRYESGPGSTTVIVPERRETVIVPETQSTVIVPETSTTTTTTTRTHESVRQEQELLDQLRLRQDTSHRALVNEADQTKREMLQREIDRLRQDIKLQEQRLRDLERQLK